MSQAERAKQFMPFAALTGYYQLVREREIYCEPKRQLSEEDMDRLSGILSHLACGDLVTVTYYQETGYRKCEGVVAKVDVQRRLLTVVKTAIAFDDIFDIVDEKGQTE
jgi:hypothetical protein